MNFHDSCSEATETLPLLPTAADEPDEVAAETGAEIFADDPGGDGGPDGWAIGSKAAATLDELATIARPVSVSRFRRCRSARISAAC